MMIYTFIHTAIVIRPIDKNINVIREIFVKVPLGYIAYIIIVSILPPKHEGAKQKKAQSEFFVPLSFIQVYLINIIKTLPQ